MPKILFLPSFLLLFFLDLFSIFRKYKRGRRSPAACNLAGLLGPFAWRSSPPNPFLTLASKASPASLPRLPPAPPQCSIPSPSSRSKPLLSIPFPLRSPPGAATHREREEQSPRAAPPLCFSRCKLRHAGDPSDRLAAFPTPLLLPDLSSPASSSTRPRQLASSSDGCHLCKSRQQQQLHLPRCHLVLAFDPIRRRRHPSRLHAVPLAAPLRAGAPPPLLRANRCRALLLPASSRPSAPVGAAQLRPRPPSLDSSVAHCHFARAGDPSGRRVAIR